MNDMKTSIRRVSLLAAATSVVLVAGCATGPANDSPADSSAAVVKISAVQSLSGVFASFGREIVNGIELAEKTINAEGLLGQRVLQVDVKDEASTPATAASLVSEAGASEAIAVIGPPGSASALATAPIAQSAGVPYVSLFASVDGVIEAGDHIYRITTQLNSLIDITLDEIEDSGAERVGFVYATDVPTLVELAEEYIAPGLAERGIDVVSAIGTSTSTTSYSSLIAQLLASQPDTVGILSVGAANPSILSELRLQGYSGDVFTHANAAGLWGAVAEEAEDLFYSTDFTTSLPFAATEKFVAAYEKEYGTPANAYAAGGYDAVMFLAQALAQDNAETRAELLLAMKSLAEAGDFVGSVGRPIAFAGEGNRQAVAPGVLVRLKSGEEVVEGVEAD